MNDVIIVWYYILMVILTVGVVSESVVSFVNVFHEVKKGRNSDD